MQSLVKTRGFDQVVRAVVWGAEAEGCEEAQPYHNAFRIGLNDHVQSSNSCWSNTWGFNHLGYAYNFNVLLLRVPKGARNFDLIYLRAPWAVGIIIGYLSFSAKTYFLFKFP